MLLGRRGFFGVTFGALLARFLPKPEPLLFHKDAFSFVMPPVAGVAPIPVTLSTTSSSGAFYWFREGEIVMIDGLGEHVISRGVTSGSG